MPAGVAQLEAQATCNRQVVGSSPTTGSGHFPYQSAVLACRPCRHSLLLGFQPNIQPNRLLKGSAMAGSMRERRSGVWELRVYLGRDAAGRVRHHYVTFEGGKRAAERELVRLVAEQDRKPDRPRR